MTNKYICDYIENSIDVKKKILKNNNIIKTIEKVATVIIEAYQNNKKVLLAGNGGSAADAQHFAAELVGKFLKERKALNALPLTANTSILTAISNDYSYDDIFSRQIEAIGENGDIFIAISTSGNSKNIINAIKFSQDKNLKVIGLTGENECMMDTLCDYIIKVPSKITPHIQESHIMIEHLICAIVEKELF